MELRCPLCGGLLTKSEKRLQCPSRHSFDIARQGYVHLLPVQSKHSAAPGDTREQVLSRRAFLETQTYGPICEALIAAARKRHIRGEMLDAGCGEGWYSVKIAESLGLSLTGLDISKEAVRWAAAKYKGHQWLCASASHLPVADESVSLLTSLFAVTFPEEFCRVLRKDGYLFQVLAAQDHLMGLKSIIYDEILLKEKDSVPELTGFTLEESIPIRFPFTVEGEQVANLFSMTPHVYRIGPAGAERLRRTEKLTDTASCVLNIYRPLP